MTRLDRRLVVGGLMATGVAAAFGQNARSYDDPEALYRALREQDGVDMEVGGGSIRVVFADGARGLDRPRILEWVHRAATAVATYFGKAPVRRYGLLVIASPGSRVGHATTFGWQGAATKIHVGTDVTPGALADDWVLVHEMVHTALPDLPRRALWLQEGNATWVEPIARAQAGQLAPAEVWREALVGLPKGQPMPDDGGMDGTQAWGRLYWGGAGFWLLAEIEIYKASRGRFLLRDALRAVNRASGGNEQTWAPEDLMRVGDAATATDALQRLYGRFSSEAVTLDIQQTFAQLGIDAAGPSNLNDSAPLSALRRRITAA